MVECCSSSLSVWSRWILARTGTRWCKCRSRTSRTGSVETYSGCLLEVCRNWDVFSFREWCGDLCKMGPWDDHELCSLSYACLYHNRTTTPRAAGPTISKVLSHMVPYTLFAIWPVQRKPGFNQEYESARPRWMWAFVHSHRFHQDPDKDHEHANELPSEGLWQFVWNVCGYTNPLL